MFQLRSTQLHARHKAMDCALSTTSRQLGNSRPDHECTGTSEFSYASEILEKYWEPATEVGGDDRLKNRAAFRLRI